MQQAQSEVSAPAINVMIVVVVYRRNWEEIRALPIIESLSAANGNPRIERWQVLIFENGGFSGIASHANNAGFLYEADPDNGGTRSAYSAALRIAERCGLNWILVLDHDTAPSIQYFLELAQVIDHIVSETSRIVALVPIVTDRGVHISPSRVRFAGRLTPLQVPVISNERCSAIASGSVFRTSFLARIAPFPAKYWLDGLDHWIFWNAFRAGFLVTVLSAQVEHSLSIRSLNAVSPSRYAQIVAAEFQLAYDTMTASERFAFRVRLLLRSILLLAKGHLGHAVIVSSAALRRQLP